MPQLRPAIILISTLALCAGAVALEATTHAAADDPPSRSTQPAAASPAAAKPGPTAKSPPENRQPGQAKNGQPENGRPQNGQPQNGQPGQAVQADQPEESATLRDDPTIAPDPKQSADNNVTFPNDI